MDTSDPLISFDKKGICNHCRQHIIEQKANSNASSLNKLVEEIRSAGQGREYDCIVGISGGTDSCFVLHTAVELGLRPLAVHVDNGWNSEISVSNIEKMVRALGVDLETHVLDWKQFSALQRAFLLSSTRDAEVPTDHLIRASLFKIASRYGIKYMLNGRNYATEGIMPTSWSYGAIDWKYISGIHRRFGKGSLRKLPRFGILGFLYQAFIMRIRNISILTYVPFEKKAALKLLSQKYEWRSYPGKHYESLYTRWYQGYYLVKKFDIDKRKAHLSVLIVNGVVTRDEALRELSKLPYDKFLEVEENIYIANKLNLTPDEITSILNSEPKLYTEFPNNSFFLDIFKNPSLHKLLYMLRTWGLLPKGFADRATATPPSKKNPH